MRPRTTLVLAFATVVAAGVSACVVSRGATAASAANAAPSPPATAHVIYLAGASVYVDAGSEDGLAEGDTLVVRRGAAEVARLRASVVSHRRSSCDTLSTSAEIHVGDEARFVAHAAAAPDTTAAPLAATPAPVARTERPWLHGRIGASWLAVREADSRFDQPMLDLRLDGGGDGAFSAALDLRGHRTTQVIAGSSSRDAEARFYRASVTMQQPNDRASITIGRQSSPSLAPVSIFDGALLEGGSRRWRVGAFAGSQPEPMGMHFSDAIREFGGYVEAHQAPLANQRWSAGLGAISSYDRAQPNRNFMFTQAFWQNRAFSGSVLQEADFAPEWKRAEGDPPFSLTSTFAGAQWTASRWLAFQSGFDNRHNVRLWRDHLTPETEFDDSYRQGVWVGASVRSPQGFGVSGDERWRGATGDLARTTTLGAEIVRPMWRGLSLRGRWSDYQGAPVSSRLLTGSLGLDPLFGAHVEVAGGQRRTDDALGGGGELTRWWSTDLDVSLARRWFANFSFQNERSDFTQTLQIMAGLSRRI